MLTLLLDRNFALVYPVEITTQLKNPLWIVSQQENIKRRGEWRPDASTSRLPAERFANN
jgi:hypothetical protein